MVINFGLLGLLKKKELVLWKKISMIVGTSKNGDRLGNGVVFDSGHGLATLRTYGCFDWCGAIFGNNRVYIPGCFEGEKICKIRFDKMTTTTETFFDGMRMSIRSFDFEGGERLMAMWAVHVFILANKEGSIPILLVRSPPKTVLPRNYLARQWRVPFGSSRGAYLGFRRNTSQYAHGPCGLLARLLHHV